ncbi:MAG: alpha/beta hydrolase [Mesorhizobium sp.]|nr:alpha/beta hydrolase [Mesorhizobium sp.]
MTLPGQDGWRAAKRTLDIGGGRAVAYVDSGGQGPVLLGLHGFTDSSRSFSLIAPYLEGLRVIAPDLRGHGASFQPADGFDIADFAGDMAAFCDRLGLARPFLAGHSLGAMVALDLAASRPDGFAGVVTLAGSLRPGIGARHPIAIAVSGLTDPIDPRDALFAEWHATSVAVDAGFLRHVAAEAAAMPVDVWRAVLATLGTADLRLPAGEIRARVLCVSGDQDPLFGPAHAAELAAALRAPDRLLLAGCGHNPHWEQPAEVARAIRAFIFSPT